MADTIYGVPKNQYFRMSAKERFMVQREYHRERVKKIVRKKKKRDSKKRKDVDVVEEPELLETTEVDETFPSIYDSDVLKTQRDERYPSGVIPVRPYPIPPGELSGVGVGGTGTPEQLEDVGRPRGGVVPIGLPPSQEERLREEESRIGRGRFRAEQAAEERIPIEVVGRFEETYTPGAQDIANSMFNSIMDSRARDVGMVRGVNEKGEQVWYYTDESQLQAYAEYIPIAEETATLRAQTYIAEQWKGYGVEQRVEDIYREEYGKERIAMVETDEGYVLMSPWRYKREQRYEEFKQQKGTDSLISHALRDISMWTRHDPFGMASWGELIFGEGTVKERGERFRETKLRSQFELAEAIKRGGIFGGVVKIVEPGTPLFTFGSVTAMSMGVGAGLGALSTFSTAAAKTAEVTMGGYFIGRTAAEVEQIATKGQQIKWGGMLGLAPVGLQARDTPMTVGERTSQLGLMALSIPFAAWGYRKGVHVGQTFAETFYTADYTTVQNPMVKIRKTYETTVAEHYKGEIVYRETGIRKFFGKGLPWTRKELTGKVLIEGIGAKETTFFFDPTTGKAQLVPAGGAVYSPVGGQYSMKGLFGLTVTHKYPTGGFFTVGTPRRTIFDVGKKTQVSIEPYVKQTDIGAVFFKQPSMSLTVTRAQMAVGVLKPIASKYHPIGGVVDKAVTKGISQTWELPEGKQIIAEPHLEKATVQYFEVGKPIPRYGLRDVDTLLYGFAPGKDPAKVFVRETETGKEPVDIFGRKGPGAISPVIRHELTHQMYPHLGEIEVQLISSAYPLPPKTKIVEMAERYLTTVDVEQLAQLRATIKPKLDRAVKSYWTKGEIPIEIQTGTELWKVTPYRQISVTTTPRARIVTQVFGVGKTLKSIQKPDTNMINYFTQKPQPPQQRPTPSKQITTMEEYTTLQFEPQIKAPSLWGETFKPGIIPILTALSASETELKQLTHQGEVNLIKYNQTPIQDILTERMQLQATEQLPTTEQQQVQLQTQMQVQTQLPTLVQTTMSLPVTTITPPPPPPPLLLLQPPTEIQMLTQPQSYQIQLKKRTYKSGERIRPDTWYNLPGTYSLYDAHAVGMQKVDNTEKASYRLIPSNRKPQKRPRGTPNYLSQAHEFYKNPKGIMVEHITSRIDSPGEINAISRKGWQARRKKSKTNKLMNRMMRIKL